MAGVGSGDVELVTAPLERGDILPGVTRQSVLDLCREWGDFKVSERTFTMDELALACVEGRVSNSLEKFYRCRKYFDSRDGQDTHQLNCGENRSSRHSEPARRV